MKIAFITISYNQIGISTTGGIETFALYLLRELERLGNHITLFSAEETDQSSLPNIDFEPTFSYLHDLELKDNDDRSNNVLTLNYAMFQYFSLAKALLKSDFDIYHFSSSQWYIPFLFSNYTNKKIITTVHVNNLRRKATSYVLKNFKGPYIANISNASAELFKNYPKRKTIHNGIPLENFYFNNNPDNYFAWLGRITPVKGLKEALLAAKKADIEFIASGPIHFPDYFNKEIKPLLDKKRSMISPLNIKDKVKFLSNAKAVLMPVLWDEPFGLVAIEAMACGTPVIAFKRGGLKETIIDGVTGFLVDSIDEMVEKIKRIDEINRKKCREHVRKNFTSEIMAKKYLNYYLKAISDKL